MATGQPHRNQEKRRILQIAHQVAATIGTDFFRAMSRHLAQALEADAVLVGEFSGGMAERIKILAGLPDDAEPFDYPLSGSASAKVAQGEAILCRSVAQHRFPEDRALIALQAQAFVGVPLMASGGTACGFLMAVYRKPASKLSTARSILDVFAPRAAAEVERKQEDDRLRESEQRYQAFVLLNTDAMWRVEFEQPISVSLPESEQFDRIFQYGYLAECNDALARQFGMEKAGQLTGSRVGELISRTDESMREAILGAIRSRYQATTVEGDPVDREGKPRHVIRSQWGIVENGELQRIWGTTRDITELKAIERQLDASEKQMSELLETLHLLVVMLQEDGTIAFCNKHLYQLTGWTPAQVVGKNWFELMLAPDARETARAAFTAAKLQSGASTHYEATLLGPEERQWWVAWDSTCVRDSAGKVVVSATVGRDISEYKMLEAQFRQAQELESLGRLAGGIAHDFNNLLTVITGYCSVLLDQKEASDPAYPALTEIRRSAEKGADLTHRLLTFSRRQPPRPEPLDLTALIARDEPLLVRLIAENVHLVTKLEPTPELTNADASQIRQVLFNLVVNARDAMPYGGTLTIGTANREVDGAKFVELTVADTGVGISEEVRRHLFEPVFSAREEGPAAGLGLSTVQAIVRQNSGRIEVDSAPGAGTRFRILLPAATDAPA